MSTNKSVLSLTEVHIHYGAVRAVQGVSLEAAERSIVALIGANGAGKSSIVNATMGLIPTKAGEISFKGMIITDMPPHKRSGLGLAYVPEGRRLFKDMSVIENLRVGAYLRKDTKGILEDLDQVWHYFPVLKERQSQLGGTLSGGEQQMAAIARALMARPKVLLLDEASLGLAPIAVHEIAKVVKRLREERDTSILMVEQNATLALGLSDYIYLLESGRIVTQGTTERMANEETLIRSYVGSI